MKTTAFAITIFSILLSATAVYRDMEPVDEERLEVLQEIINACFVPAVTPRHVVGEMKALERNLGYISASGVNYVFATLGYTDESTKQQLKELIGTSHMPPQIKIKAKPVKKNLTDKLKQLEHQPMRVVTIIETETGTTLEKTRAYVDKYQIW